jgi:hypothetical protein
MYCSNLYAFLIIPGSFLRLPALQKMLAATNSFSGRDLFKTKRLRESLQCANKEYQKITRWACEAVASS